MSGRVRVDYLVIGSGVAGLYTALNLSEHGEVLIITKESVTDANTSFAQGGIASVFSGNDSFESHIQDTLIAGAGLCDPQAVEVLVKEGPAHIRRLMELGARFEVNAEGQLDLGREGGHSANRIVHAGDLTGKEVELALERACRERGIRILENHVAVELITKYHLQNEKRRSEPPQCFGCYVYDRKSWDIFIVEARATVIATGGAGSVYLHNTNPDVATGDGIALGWNAGATVANLEFYQFHPTSLYDPGRPTFLISEALRGYGAILRNHEGEAFMARYDERRELAPRDIVARAIDAELKRTGASHVLLDATHKQKNELMSRFPHIYATSLERGIDISSRPIPVVPAAHYMCGGVTTDLNGRTTIGNLYAVGEVACTGVHGGNRLASNSLLEGLVFASRIAGHIKEHSAGERAEDIKEWNKEGLENAEEWILVQHNLNEIRQVMWDYVGIVRSNLRLNRAARRIELLHNEVQDFYRRTVIQNKIIELRNLALVANLIVKSALMRKESRGLHFTTDYPENRDPSRSDSRQHR